MPIGTKVEKCVKKLKKSAPEVNPYAVCQASTGQSYATGKTVTKEGKPIKKGKKAKTESIDKFISFLNDIKKPDTEIIIEAVKKAFNVCFESDEEKIPTGGASFLNEDGSERLATIEKEQALLNKEKELETEKTTLEQEQAKIAAEKAKNTAETAKQEETVAKEETKIVS